MRWKIAILNRDGKEILSWQEYGLLAACRLFVRQWLKSSSVHRVRLRPLPNRFKDVKSTSRWF